MGSKPGARRGPYAKTASRRAEILATARESFRRNGYRGSSFRQIAEATGLSQAGLLHHFGSKDELLIAVLEQRDSDHVAATVDDRGLAVFEGLQRILAEAHRERGITELFTKLSAEATDPDNPGHDFFVARYRRVRETISSQLRAGGELSVDAEVAATLVAAVMDGLQLQWLLEDSLEIEDAFAQFVALLSRGRD